ncbi:tubulin epsilon chain [Nomia melanderi]|uniref:tubulin epsilon chain n=1 Tax=Nomia melanderi TaxID=2448451 RepID=UPI0013047C35|nr:tubulin epsilon chain-like [Nomia melanderi]
MSEFITVQVGQCGNQIGSAFWPLVLHEYGVQSASTGTNFLKIQRNYGKKADDLLDAIHSFFVVPDNLYNFCFKSMADLKKAKVKARAVLIDMEDNVIAGLKRGPLGHLYEQACTITNYPGSANNWAIGYHDHGTKYHDNVENAVRRAVEKCSSLHGFLCVHSLGGGTGSGLGTATLKLLADYYPNVDRLVSCVYPMLTQDVVTAPYNALLATRELLEHATCVFPVDNASLMDICALQMKKKENADQINYNVSCRPFQDMNSIVVNMLLHLTSGSRFPGNLNMDMNEIATNLVPYPRLHYIYSSVSPIDLTASITYTAQEAKLQDELFSNAWSRNNRLIKVDPLQPNGVILSSAHIARGNCSMTDLKRNIERFRGKMKFTIWSEEAAKVGLCSVPPAGHSASVLCLLNCSAMSGLFRNVLEEFSRLYRRKAHVHHYTQVEGFDEADFRNGTESIRDSIAQYRELENPKRTDVPRLQVI